VVAFYTHPAFLVGKFLAKWFVSHTGFTPEHAIKNSRELVDLLQNQRFPVTARLFSFDATNLFTNVPVADTIKLMVDMLTKKNIATQPQIAEFRALIKKCVEHNICLFKNKIFKFPDGLPIGGPFSSLLADVFLNNLEESILNNFPVGHRVTFWIRYVDDVLCVWLESDSEIHKFLCDLKFPPKHILHTGWR
jgi:hypothetical protein